MALNSTGTFIPLEEPSTQRRDSGGQVMEYAKELAQQAQKLSELAYQCLAPISVQPAGLKDRLAAEPPRASYFAELFGALLQIESALDAIRAALDAVDV